MSKSILVIDDDNDICKLLIGFLTKKGFEVEAAQSGAEATKELKRKAYDLILCDHKLPDTDSIEMLQRIKVICPDTKVIIITGYSDIQTAVSAFKYGAVDYVTKPLFPDEIVMTIKEALNNGNKPVAEIAGKSSGSETESNRFIIGKSPQSEGIQKYIDLIAPSDMTVIITGETGTGKEFVAKAIHSKSKRSNQPFVAIDCGSLPRELAGRDLFGHVKGAFTGAVTDKKGSFEAANGGTLFLDEIGNLSYENQVKLLRVLQERKIKRIGNIQDINIDVRILTATNEDLVTAVTKGEFREDLYHRLNEFKIEIAPLRERREDIIQFAEHFLKKANASLEKEVKGFSEEVIEKFKSYYWHGNLRELNNVVKRSVLLAGGDMVTLENLPTEIISPNTRPSPSTNGGFDYDFGTSQEQSLLKSVSGIAERQAILDVLEKTAYNKTKAAELLNIDRKTLYNKLKAYGIKL